MTTETTTQAIEHAALSTAEQMLPVLLAGIASGMQAGTPQAAVIAMIAEVVPPLIQSFGATSSQIQSLMTALAINIEANQQVINAAAAARGIPVVAPVAQDVTAAPVA